MIAAVATVYNEADLIEKTLSHMLNGGVDHVWVADASTDGTKDLYSEFGPQLTVHDDTEPYHYQPRWINRMLQEARAAGADWVIPFDADEFWYAEQGGTIKAALEALGPQVAVVHVGSYQHVNFDYRLEYAGGLSKVAVRAQENVEIANGNHHAWGYAGDTEHGVLAIRELMFRSLEHLHRKSRERVERLDPALPAGDGVHQRELQDTDDAGRAAAWAERVALATIYDPIPYAGTL